MKPKIFIGSSSEGLHVAEAIQSNLDHVAYVQVWTQGAFELSSTTLDDLIKVSEQVDFAIFVLMPDDTTVSREITNPSIRDNVIFELGLFIGKLSKEKVYFIKPRGSKLHMPTDLLGITAGEFDLEHHKIDASVGSFCTKVKQKINELFVIDYPQQGRYGKNILHTDTMSIEAGHTYSMAVRIPSNGSLVAKFDYTGAIGFNISKRLGFKELSQKAGMGIEKMDLHEKEGEVQIQIHPADYFKVELFFNGNSNPVLTKIFKS